MSGSLRSVLCSAPLALAAWSLGASAQQNSTAACGTIINASNNQDVFNASLVQECLTSVPFNAAVATRFLAYFNDTMRFQSSLAYLKNPPASYQSASVDVMGSIQAIQDGIDSNAFSNQYEFELALQKLIFATRDEHVFLLAGIINVFTFASPRNVVSVSTDGIDIPKLYLYDDVYDSNSFATFQPSPIRTINGQDATAYMESFAANNSYDVVEPHASWNQMMMSGALSIQGDTSVFTGNAWFYPGDSITWELENGTTFTEKFLGLYWTQGPTGALQTPGDFYNCFVLGLLPASYDPFSDNNSGDSGYVYYDEFDSTVEDSTTPAGWDSIWYPTTPDVVQPNLNLDAGGYLTGYFLNSTSTSVLSIPSFNEYYDALDTFETTVDEFITRSQAAGLTKVVIDLQQNTGGQVLLAIATFVRFFPNIKPYAASQMRAHDATNVMGKTMTAYYQFLQEEGDQEDADILSANEWVATSRVNAQTGANFTSWGQFYGPHAADGDEFTTKQQYNLNSTGFVAEAVDDNDGTFSVYNSTSTATEPPFAADSIILLTDGICGSACSLFIELMHHQANVRVVTVGGRPDLTPMQGASGSRGARALDFDTLDANIAFVQDLLLSSDTPAAAHFLPNRSEAHDVFVLGGGINLRDQVRAAESTPLQFLYEPADCRIFFTPKTVLNYTALWEYAAEAAWQNSSLCVAGAGNVTTMSSEESATNTTTIDVARFDIDAQIPQLANGTDVDVSTVGNDALLDTNSFSKANITSVACSHDKDCKSTQQVCRKVQLCANTKATGHCVNKCKFGGSAARCVGTTGAGTCRMDTAAVKVNTTAGVLTNPGGGYCAPTVGKTTTACKKGQTNKLSSLI